MGRFSGFVGFSLLTETEPGVYEETIVEKRFHGDTIRRRLQVSGTDYSSNPKFTLSVDISIVATKFATENLGFMKYVVYKGQKWEIQAATPEPPRITLSIGGLYNENST